MSHIVKNAILDEYIFLADLKGNIYIGKSTQFYDREFYYRRYLKI